MLLGHDDTSEPWSITRVDTPQYYHTICMPNPSGSIVKPPFSSDVEHGFLMGERQETFFAHMESELMPHVRSFMRAVGITDESGNFINMPELVIGHQPSGPLFAKGVELSGIPLSQFVQNFKKYGNTISAELPMTLDDAVRDGTLTRGMRVLFWVYGAGYTEGIVYLTY
ncbi:TPA: hypothetical protein DCZ32_00385 [Candidatus Uhrbacteria bacterium]|nr:hypothetical protein [Candidatus Uhrbacteria bacterium]